MSNLDFVIHILNKLQELYNVVLDGMESRLMLSDGDANRLTIENFRYELNNCFEHLDKREKQATPRNIALKAWGRQYKGICRNCSKYGHNAEQCPKKGKEHFKGT